jgi:iron(III) transport system ATP-binding protein
MSDSIIRIKGLGHRYGDDFVLSDVSLDVRPGELLSVLGVSGSGKSTLLRAIAGFVTPSAGQIEIAGRVVCDQGSERVSAQHRNLGMMFQDYALFPFMTVGENVGFGIHDHPDRDERVAELLAMVGLAGFEARRPATLSGGQQQRVALIRALAPKPVALLLDEPFANLDGSLREAVGDEVRQALRRENTPGILVTHDRNEALGLADRVALLGPIDGSEHASLMQLDEPSQVYAHPETKAVATLTGPVVFVDGVADGSSAETPFGPVTLSDPMTGQVTLAIRPHQLRYSESMDGACVVAERQFLGPDYRARVTTPIGEVWLSPSATQYSLGGRGDLTVTGACVAFNR